MSSKKSARHLLVLTSVLVACAAPDPQAAGLEFAVSFDPNIGEERLDGRVLLILSTDGEREPRFQVGAGLSAPQIFGIDIEGLEPGAEAVIDGDVFGFPKPDLARVPPGDYYVQAVLHKY
jgi:hypothetical protein